ncbi:GNAT family N-acetyltransferase [Paraburkholderia bonniea]|uniref:GNAT family N-acetyltransferase n=1 Tax=Paraburkholderia bonniea TaxID=2152891 RepID=UPI0012928A67|nr:GNAT family N-acetyltransferase [Paraburkholderia bonniea]WJF90939.1 GNAT family N-acetyltransferase [Paraburkholderia bonniea]WJF94253.1 GNAT family N-acetyltransferase [Paraburkholderia bonniea]
MSFSLTVRRIAANQGEVFHQLRTTALREAPYAFDQTLEDALAVDAATFELTAARRAVSAAATTFILYTEGHPAGLIDASFDAALVWRGLVSELWVAPAVRHLRGGELLVNTASDWLIARGATDIYAWVADANRNARHFYEHLGFIPAGEQARMGREENQWATLLVRPVPLDPVTSPASPPVPSSST